MDAEQTDFTELDNALHHQERIMSVPRALATEASIKRKQVIGETSAIAGNIEHFIIHNIVLTFYSNLNVLFCSQSHVRELNCVDTLPWESKEQYFCGGVLYQIFIIHILSFRTFYMFLFILLVNASYGFNIITSKIVYFA